MPARQPRPGIPQSSVSKAAPAAAAPPSGIGLASESARLRMIESLRASGVRDADVLAAMQVVPRHLFIEGGLASRAYDDVSLPIGHAQTISRPATVARMIELVSGHLTVAQRRQGTALEVGTGCGYQAAVLAQMFGDVVTIERLRALHEAARANLRSLRQANLRLVFGDGCLGAAQAAPFDAIVIAAAGEAIADELLLQMRVGGRLIAPIVSAQGNSQSLHLVERVGQDDWHLTVLDAVKFVPLRSGTR